MPWVALTLSLFVLSQSALFVRAAMASAVAIGFWRMVMALPILAALVIWKRKGLTQFRFSRAQWMRFLACGFFLFAHFYFWFLSVQKTSLTHSMILFCSNPLFTSLGAWIFLGERIKPRHILSMLLCFLGIYCLLADKAGLHTLEGDIWGLLCALLFSAYVLVSKSLRRGVENLPFALVTYSITALFFLSLMVSTGTPFFSYGMQSWASFAALAVGSTLLGHALFSYCLEHFPVNFLSISTMLEPVLTAITASLFFAEPISKAAVLGFFFVASGIVALCLPGKRWL